MWGVGSSDMKLKAKIFYKSKTEKLKRDIYKQYNPVFGLVGCVGSFRLAWFSLTRFRFYVGFVFEYFVFVVGVGCVYSNKCQWGLHFGIGGCAWDVL